MHFQHLPAHNSTLIVNWSEFAELHTYLWVATIAFQYGAVAARVFLLSAAYPYFAHKTHFSLVSVMHVASGVHIKSAFAPEWLEAVTSKQKSQTHFALRGAAARISFLHQSDSHRLARWLAFLHLSRSARNIKVVMVIYWWFKVGKHNLKVHEITRGRGKVFPQW